MTDDSLPDAPLGLHDPAAFRLATGKSAGETLAPTTRFLFRDETIAVPVAPDPSVPPLVWIAAPQRRIGAFVSSDGKAIEAGGLRERLELVPKIALNRSYADASTFAWLAGRSLTVRGTARPPDAFEARTLWPDDWRLDPNSPLAPLETPRGEALAVRSFVRADGGGARSPFATRVLWARDPGKRDWVGRPVLGVMVNGSQGDDDEAWGGHFAIVTGRLGVDGRIADLLAANFYSLDVESEKGILAAPVPLDNYLADLNAGQAWYRPSALVLAILADDRAAALADETLARVYPAFWSRRLPYRHTTMNCAAISVDALRTMGWPVPSRTNAWRSLAWLALPAKLAQTGRLDAARDAFEYLAEDPVRLFPAAAFEECAADLLRLATKGVRSGDGPLADRLAKDMLALVALRVPQIPSSRAFGSFPVASPREYLDAWPPDPADAQLVPLPPRAFPPESAGAAPPVPKRRPSDLAVALGTLTGVLPLAWLLGVLWRAVRPGAKPRLRE